MPPPLLSVEQVLQLFPDVETVGTPFVGGQKLVFPCQSGENKYVIKVLQSDSASDEDGGLSERSGVDDVYERAKREVDILQKSQTSHLPKLGPIKLQRMFIDGQSLVVFSEEFISGSDLSSLIKSGFPFDNVELLNLGKGVASAIAELWRSKRIHRDVKPQNIMRRDNGEYVLLDPGIAFDLEDISLTATGFVPHTPGYIAPECVVPDAKRDADCRSDFFLLGIVLYVCATGCHPFMPKANVRRGDVIASILRDEPPPVTSINAGVSIAIESIIMRLLSKRKHARFKNPEILMQAFAACEKE